MTAKKNKILQCELCKKIWQTHERNEVLEVCPNCGSQEHFDFVAKCGDRMFSSHMMPRTVYNELIFGSELGRTWHTECGEVKGWWIEQNNTIKS
jgi:predicted RNA-binding Zn-ribbon protein involved in translation (DUF1610 family)